jgi:hypothetical protein
MIEPADFSYVPAGNGRCGMSFSDPHLRSLGIDIRAMARGGTLAQTSHPAMPAQILTLTRHWLKLGGRGAPQWSQFELLDVAEVAPYLTIAECLAEHTFHFTFIGSAVSALLGEDVRDRQNQSALYGARRIHGGRLSVHDRFRRRGVPHYRRHRSARKLITSARWPGGIAAGKSSTVKYPSSNISWLMRGVCDCAMAPRITISK